MTCYESKEKNYYEQNMDIVCEDNCYKDFVKIHQPAGLNSKEIIEIHDEREECLTECFIARKGSTDAEYCIEKCNETFNQRMSKVLITTSNILASII